MTDITEHIAMICKVIAVSFGGREVRKEARYTEHPQNITSASEALDMLKDVIELESTWDAGEPVDLIVVNSDRGFPEGNRYIESIDGQKTRNGIIRAYTRPNVGWSFGSYDDAFKKYGKLYDKWIFTEDDIIIGGDNYAKKLSDRWNEIEGVRIKIGFLSLIGVIKHPYGIHCGGGVGMSSREVLDSVVERFGSLPHHDGIGDESLDPERIKNLVIVNGEVAFTNKMDGMGYYLFEYGSCKGWNLEENLCVPYHIHKHG